MYADVEWECMFILVYIDPRNTNTSNPTHIIIKYGLAHDMLSAEPILGSNCTWHIPDLLMQSESQLMYCRDFEAQTLVGFRRVGKRDPIELCKVWRHGKCTRHERIFSVLSGPRRECECEGNQRTIELLRLWRFRPVSV
jgi:hypothetical protein